MTDFTTCTKNQNSRFWRGSKTSYHARIFRIKLRLLRCLLSESTPHKSTDQKEFNEAFSKYDVLLAPASPFTAPKIGESLKDPLAMYLGDIYTVAVNLCGLPGITVPCGKDSKGLPIGIQMIGDCFMEKKILRAAHAYETSRGSFAVPGEGGTR